MTTEAQIEQALITKLTDLKYTPRPDIRSREALERNFREKFQALNRCKLSDAEFARLRDEITTADVFAASQRLRERNTFTREDGTPLQYMLVNISEWCKNEFEIVSQLRMKPADRPFRQSTKLKGDSFSKGVTFGVRTDLSGFKNLTGLSIFTTQTLQHG